jgi:plasmid stabilization system protein ParE
MYQLIIKPHAVQTAKEAYEWYEEQLESLGNAFLNEVDRCYDKLELRPLLYAKIKRNFRQIILNTFPYVIVFEVFKNDVIVYAVFHTSRNPRKKFKK